MAVDARIEAFLIGEARLMDENRYAEWLALWAENGRYWVPCNADDGDPATTVSIIYDDYERLCQRVERLASGTVQAQQPAPRMRRILGGFEAVDGDGVETTVESNFILAVARERSKEIWAGRTTHRLRTHGDSFRIVSKKVVLIDLDQELPILQFLI